jgi:pyruvate dehydrogenase E1 component alpha subunit
MSTKQTRHGATAKVVTPPGKDAGPESFSLISNGKLMALYANLLKCRMIEKHSTSLPGRGKTNGTLASIRGYEAGTVGVAIDLGSDDAVCSPDRGVLKGFPNGAPIDSLLLWSGVGLESNGFLPSKSGLRNGRSAAKPGHAHTQAAIGAALAHKTSKNGKVAIVFGDESASDSWREALHIATVHALPMIFVLRKRGKPAGRSRTSDSKKVAKPDTPWFPSITVDSNDVVAIYRVSNEAISRARSGRGPTLIECQPFRLSGTFNGNGKHSHDPILNMENYLRAKGLFRPETKDDILKAAARELQTLIKTSNGRVARSSH